jgi:hypothetical protein
VTNLIPDGETSAVPLLMSDYVLDNTGDTDPDCAQFSECRLFEDCDESQEMLKGYSNIWLATDVK